MTNPSKGSRAVTPSHEARIAAICLPNERCLVRPLPEAEPCSTVQSELGQLPADFAQRPCWRGLLRASWIGPLRWALSLALGVVVVLMLAEAAAAAARFPSGLPPRWCGTERTADFQPGWFPQDRAQVKVVYAYANDRPTAEFQRFSDRIQRDVKDALETVGDASGGLRSIAFDLGTECGSRYVDIASVPLDRSSDEYWQMPPTVGGRSAVIQGEVRTKLGLGADDRLGGGKRNFAVYVNIGLPDTPSEAADVGRGDLPGCPKGAADESCQPDDRPGPENIANVGGFWAWVWGPFYAPARRFAMLHEITHNLGAVQDTAPNSSFKPGQPRGPNNAGGHCRDFPDVMCPVIPPERCYDCKGTAAGRDYFDVNPQPGSYLATHWNVARSVFTCPYHSSPAERGCAPQGAAGDFNGDGRADLAVGVPQEDVGTVTDAGAVNILYGGASGLSSSQDQFWHQNQPGVRNSAEAGDRFGSALASGDFNGDGFADLAVGVPDEDVATVGDAGSVHVFYGSASGLSFLGDELWRQDALGTEIAGAGDNFGAALAAGDFSGDGFADLAVGAPFRGRHDRGECRCGQRAPRHRLGALLVWRPHLEPEQRRSRRRGARRPVRRRPGGGRLHSRRLRRPGGGRPREDVGANENAGAVSVLYGIASGLSETGAQFWTQNSKRVLDIAEADDRFGVAMAAGDFSGDGRADLAVGVPREDAWTVADAGAVNVLYGKSSGLSAFGDQFWSQGSPGVRDVEELADRFGDGLAAGDFSDDGCSDLAVGVPLEDVPTPTHANAGAVNVLHCRASGLSAVADEFWHQDSPSGVRDIAEAGDDFGYALAAADFSGDLAADLAVGVPLEDQAPPRAADDGGAVNVLHGGGVGLGQNIGSNQFWHQNSFLVLDVAEPNDFFGLALAP